MFRKYNGLLGDVPRGGWQSNGEESSKGVSLNCRNAKRVGHRQGFHHPFPATDFLWLVKFSLSLLSGRVSEPCGSKLPFQVLVATVETISLLLLPPGTPVALSK